jgi:periplasmic mercuric ion binding protein
MKTITMIFAILMMTGTSVLFAQEKTEKFKANGNCGMCGKRIEAAALSVDGVASAKWDNKTKVVEISYDQSEANLQDVHKAVAKSGHDTDMHRASDEVYAKLHGCCKYNREEVKVKQECGQSCHGH